MAGELLPGSGPGIRPGEAKPYNAILSGVVTDQNDNPISGAAVLVLELKSGTLTTSTGVYGISLPKGTYNITYSYLGCETLEYVDLKLPKDQSYVQNVKLNCDLFSKTQPNFKDTIVKIKKLSIIPKVSTDKVVLHGEYPDFGKLQKYSNIK
jgi:hypothetical protein